MRVVVDVWLVGALLACTGDDPEDPFWYSTCGDPVCETYRGPFDGVPACQAEAEGEACESGALDAQCDLENACNQFLICATEDPKDTEFGCPISKRAAKRDIVYVDANEREQLRQQALATKLATWRYRHEGADGRPHLGFIIEDQPGSPAVRADGERVDLYGYASLALAAVQAQEAELAALRAEVAALRDHCGVSPR